MTLFAKNNGEKPETDVKSNIFKILFGAALGIVTYIVLILIFAFVMTVSSVPESAEIVFSFAAVAIGSFVAGFASLWNIGRCGLINGLICGSLLACIHLLAALLFGDGGRLVYLIVSAVIEIVLSTFGGIVSVNARAK